MNRYKLAPFSIPNFSRKHNGIQDSKLSCFFKNPLFFLGTVILMGTQLEAQEAIKDTTTVLQEVIIATPLNKSFEVNAGGFGAKNVMEVPLAIQSYGIKQIREMSARTVRDVLISDPSVQNSSYGGGFDNFRLRGFAMDNFNTIRRDGLALAPHYDVPLELVERVDVLKGPSGFLYGFNSPGGTINYIPKRPTIKSYNSVVLQTSTLQNYYAAIDHSLPLLDGKIGYRVNAGIEKVGNFNHFGDLERKFAGLATDFRISDKALLQLNADWAWKSAMSDPLLRADQSSRLDPLEPSTFILPPQINRRDALSPSWYRHKTEAYNIEAKFDYKLNENWTSITQANFSQVTRHGGYADFFSIHPNGDIGYADLYQSRGEVFSTWSVQSHVAGKFATGAIKHDLFAGLGYRQFRDKSPFWDFVESVGDISVSDISVGNILNPVQPPRWDFGAEQDIDFKSNIQESSLFASDLITLNEKFQVLLGGRYIWYKARNLSAVALPQDKNIFVPTGAFIYRPEKKLMTYLSYSRGFEKGDYAPFSANNANQPTDAIASTQYELGVKIDINKQFNMELAMFDIKRDASYLSTTNDFVSDGRFHHRGIELNTRYLPISGLSILGNFSYMDAKLKEVADHTILGKRTEGAPRWKGTIGGRYALESILSGLSVDCNLNYMGERAVDAQNSGFIPSYTLLDAGVSYSTKIGKTNASFRLHGRNLTDEYYYAGVYYSGGLEVGRTRELFLTAQFWL